MSRPEMIEKQPYTIAQVKEALKKIRKRDNEELNFRAQRTEEYVNELSVLKPKDSAEVVEKITALEIPRLKAEIICKLADTMPVSEKHLKVILQGYTATVSPENQKKIMGVLDEYRPKK